MGKIVLGLAVSLDGYIEGPGGNIDWCFTDQDYGMSEFLAQVDGLLMGRKSYELVQRLGGNQWKDKITWVLSRTLHASTDPRTVFVHGDLSEIARRLRQQDRSVWLFGGSEIFQQFITAGLVDEYWLSVHPVVLGGGKPLFPLLHSSIPLRLLETKAYSTGLVSLKYGRH